MNVVIPSRMRVDRWWSDVCIRNISAHGLLIVTADPPQRGSYVEIRRGTQTIIARSMWADGQRCGLRAQDRIVIERIIAEPRLAGRPEGGAGATADTRERRGASRPTAPSIADREARSRRLSAAFQFGIVTAVAVGLGTWAARCVYLVMNAPAAAIGHALAH